MSNTHDALRHSFGPIAALYHAVRPGYPPQVVDLALAQTATPTPRMLDIGCGNGQATEQFAHLGVPILASDPSAAMLDLARQRLADFPNITYLEGNFEDLVLPDGGFDLLIAAQSFHWVDLKRGIPQAQRVLAPGGGMALFWNFLHYDADPLLSNLRDTCLSYAPAFAGWPDAGEVLFTQFRTHWHDAFQEAPGFAAPEEHLLTSELRLPQQHFLQLLSSFSWAQALEPDHHRALLAQLATQLHPAPEPITVPIRTLVVTTRRAP